MYTELLRKNPSYLRLWMAQAVSLLGDWFTTIALSTLVARFSNGSGVAVGGLLLARFLPPVLVGPFAGVLIDRLNRKHLLIFSDAVRAVIALLFLFASRPDRLWMIYALTILQAALSALFEPCRSALLPALVEDRDLVLANTLGSTTWSVMLAAGAVVGGAVAAIFGTSIALCIDAASFVISALLIASIRVDPARVSSSHDESHPKHIVEAGRRGSFLAGLRYIASQPATAAALLIKLGGNVGNADLFMVIYATQLFVIGENGTGSLGILYGAFGAGALLGAVVVNYLGNVSVVQMRRLIIVSYICLLIGWFVLGSANSLALASLALMIRAIGAEFYWVYSNVILQKTVPDQFRGRVFALDLAGYQFATVASALVTGALVDQGARLSGISLSTALRITTTGQAVFTAGQPAMRLIAYGFGVASLAPLMLWGLALPWIERQRVVEA